MISYTRVYRWLHIVVATIVIWSQGVLQNAFERHGLKSWATFGVMVIAIVALQTVDRLSAYAIDKLRWLRRLLAGRSDIEGDWLEAVKDPAEPEGLSHLEYTRVKFQDGQYVLYGESWSLEGKSRGSFEAKDCNYNDTEKRLDFVFTTGPYLVVGGFGMWYFDRNEAPPKEFRCHYIDEGSQKLFFVFGRRIDKRFRQINRLQMREKALEFKDEVKPHDFPEYSAYGVRDDSGRNRSQEVRQDQDPDIE